MLDTIQSVYASTSTQTLVYLQSKLLLMKMKEKDGLCSFVSKFHKVRVQICNIDTNYPEIAMAVMLLNALLRLYDGLKSTLNAQPKNLTLNTLQQQLLHEDMTCQSSDAITPKEEIQAFQAQDLVLVSSCQREEAPEVDKVEVVVVAVAEVKEEETEVMVEMEVEDKEVVLVEANISNVTPTNGSTQFILDSSASHHMCSNHEYFTDLDTTDHSVEITIANGTTIKAARTGHICLNLELTDSATTEGVFTDILYVPGMNKNLGKPFTIELSVVLL
ncbi:hypothetical protein FRB93_004967 [Tulasnella sp. JGI-2019a]|nr:hypothetical protein FRB93_004967 [Tulasnella sp. JGI-2019a]